MFAYLRGIRTFLSAGAIGLAGTLFAILSSVGAVDPAPIVAMFVHDPALLPGAVALLTIGFAVLMSSLRLVTDTSAGGRQSASQSAPLKTRVDHGE